jgi:4-oxalomesaconate hydratase
LTDTAPITLLCIGAHPADIFDQSGGTMAHHVARGDRVAAAVLTHGARIHDAVISDELFKRDSVPEAGELTHLLKERADNKAEEVRQACRALGFDELYFLDLDDGVFLPTEAGIRPLARLIRDVKPTIILTHFPWEGDGVTNQHAIGGQIALHAQQLAASVDPGDTNPPHKVAQVFFFGTGAAAVRRDLWSARGGFTNDVFVDTTDVIDKKLASLDALVSQGYGGAYARKRIETADGAFGSAARTAYAEGFIKMNAEVHYYLPLTDRAKTVAESSDHENIERQSLRHNV